MYIDVHNYVMQMPYSTIGLDQSLEDDPVYLFNLTFTIIQLL